VSRWAAYLATPRPRIHWYAILNSLVLLFFLTALVAIILVRTLTHDIAHYNGGGGLGGSEAMKDYPDDVTGWKLLHGDVFRPPRGPGILCPLLGCGVQSFTTLLATGTLLLLGLVSPVARGSAVSAGLILYACSGVVGGYVSGRFFKLFRCMSWKRNAGLTAFLYPSLTLVLVFLLNLVVLARGASNSLPLGTFVALVLLIVGISLPLVYVGALVGFRTRTLDVPTRTNQIPRQIPEQAWYLKPLPSVLAGGGLPFAVIFLELNSLVQSFWSTDADSLHYMVGFGALVLGLLLVTVVEISVLVTYLNLAAEDYRWQWKSFLVGGSSALYVFAYAVLYYFTSLDAGDAVSGMLYLTYSFLACAVYALCCGAVGFLAAFAFVARIFSSIKVGGWVLAMYCPSPRSRMRVHVHTSLAPLLASLRTLTSSPARTSHARPQID
jgi:transmembrane 9 superfamily protein 2/4